MTFAITKYIYPLKEEISLSSHLSYTFDNPRTDEEITLVKEFITATFTERSTDKESSILPILTRAIFSISRLKQQLQKVDKENYALKYYNDNYEKNMLDILSEIWIIVRMPEENEFNDLQKDRTKLFSTVFSRKQTAYTNRFAELLHYSHIVSLLANNHEKYHGESFILSKSPYEIFFTSTNEDVYEAVEEFNGYNNIMEHEHRYNSWLYWVDGFERIIQAANRIDSLIIQDAVKDLKKVRLSQKQTPKQKLLHIGGLLKTSYQHSQDPELMLLLQVSIIEYLVTRTPDTTKFNVEDSISKQFKLKCAVLIHSRDKEYDLVKLTNELAKIYDQRSDLAHGNYKEVYNSEEIIQSLLLLFIFNTHLVNAFVDDRNLIEFLKDN